VHSSFKTSVLAAAALFARPQPVTFPMVALFAIIPVYIGIGHYVADLSPGAPETAFDQYFALVPAWSIVYLSLFLAVLLPVFVIHQQALVRRVILAYLAVWLIAYCVFLAFPSAAPVHGAVRGDGFFAVVLRAIYHADVPYNCFPSLHVAQCFLAAFSCGRIHRGVGWVAGVWAVLVALSTLFTKQHYVADVVGGILLACAAYFIFLRGFPRTSTPEPERRLAPLLAAAAFGLYGLIVACIWFAYAVSRA
jgi:membrane-associated phospholipid phosphatase